MAEEQSKNEDQNNAQNTSESEAKTEESTASQDDDAKETKQSNDKSSTKPKTPVKETKEKKSKKQEKEESEDESDDEELVGLLDAPLVVEGKRVRKSTEFLSNTLSTPQSIERKKIEIPQGKGELLGNMPRVQFQLSRIPADELKPLHKLLFGKLGLNSEVKKNIRLFNGFDIEKGSQEYKKKEEQVDRFTTDSLRRLCEILDVEKKGKKEEMLEKVMDFLLLPKASGKPVKQPSKKGSASKKSKTKRKRPEKEKEGKSKKKKSDEPVESDEDSEAEGEEDEEPPPKKSKSTVKSVKKEKKESKKPAKKEKKVVPIKISPGKKAKKAKEKKPDSDSSDDEPLSKRAKKSPPTNEEIVALVKELLDGADLEKITMKSICKQVYERFPDFDLTDRKEFIKDSVKEIIT